VKKRKWKKYAFEFLSIFLAVISAFALTNWNENRRDQKAESKILAEISHGLDQDKEDVKLNIAGHKYGINAIKFWRRIITNEETKLDTLESYYFNFLRDFVSIQNTSGYENLKSRGLELIENDSLRTAIISLYENDYQTLKKLEEDYYEMQFHENYFQKLNNIIAPNLQFDKEGKITGIELPVDIDKNDKNILLSYLWKVEENREFILRFYGEIQINITKLKERIESEI